MSTIAKLRQQKQFTQRQVADRLGVDVSTVRNWERNREGVQMFVRVAKLCEVFECNPQDLYETTPEPAISNPVEKPPTRKRKRGNGY